MESEEYMQQSVRVQIIQSGFWLLYLDGHLVHSIICNAAEVPPGWDMLCIWSKFAMFVLCMG